MSERARLKELERENHEVQTEMARSGNSRNSVREGAEVVCKYRYIRSRGSGPAEANRVVPMCLSLAVSTSGLCPWVGSGQSVTVARRHNKPNASERSLTPQMAPAGIAGYMPIWQTPKSSVLCSWCASSCSTSTSAIPNAPVLYDDPVRRAGCRWYA